MKLKKMLKQEEDEEDEQEVGVFLSSSWWVDGPYYCLRSLSLGPDLRRRPESCALGIRSTRCREPG